MGRLSKYLAFFLCLIVFVSCLTLLIVKPAAAYYTSSSLRITSPISTVAYDNPIDFSVYMSDRGLFDWGGPYKEGLFNVFWIGYSLDDNHIVTIMDIDLNSDNYTLWGGKDPPIIASQSISGIPEGQHKIVAYAKGHFTHVYGVSEYEISSEPTYFTIGDTVIPPPTPTPTPTTEPNIKFKSEILSPSTNASYTDVMPLNFTVDWIREKSWVVWIVPVYSYSIDNGSKVKVNNEQFIQGGPYINWKNSENEITVTSDTIDISNLTDGVHTLTLYAQVSVAAGQLYGINCTIATTEFQVGKVPSQIDDASQNTNQDIAIIAVVIFAVIVVAVATLLLRRKRKTAYLRL